MASKRQRVDCFDVCPECGQHAALNSEGKCWKCLSRRLTDMLRVLKGNISNPTSTYGKLTWEINNFRELLEERNITRVSSLRSQPFFTSQYGYKLCVQLDVFHNVLKNRLDIFVRPVILKGPNDAVIAWPFKKKITFTVINQDDRERKWRMTYRPDPTKACFKKPTSEMNVASDGIVFPDVDRLLNQGFIKNDTLILKSKCQT